MSVQSHPGGGDPGVTVRFPEVLHVVAVRISIPVHFIVVVVVGVKGHQGWPSWEINELGYGVINVNSPVSSNTMALA